MADKELVITHLQIIHTWAEFARERDLQFFTSKHLEDIAQWSDDAINLLKEQEPRVMTLDEAAAAHEVWAEVWLSGPKKYVIVVTVLYLTDDCKNFELELLGTNKKAFMLTEAYGHTWRCWTARPTEDQRLAVKWDA